MKTVLLAVLLCLACSLTAHAVPTLVQHVVCPGQERAATTITILQCRLPNVVGSGNAVVIGISETCTGGPPCTSAPAPSSITDDIPNTYTAVANATRAGINNKIFVYQLCNITNGPRIIKVNFASAQAQPDRTVVVSEYAHVATTSCVDTSVSNCSSMSGGLCNTSTPGLTLTTGSFTTTVNGDLIWSFGVVDDSSWANSVDTEVTTFTPQGSFTMLHGDLKAYHTGNAFVQGTLGTNNYNISTYDLSSCGACSTEDWVTGTVALKVDDTKGTLPTAGAIHVDRVFHLNLKDAAWTTQAKTQIPRGTANLIVWAGAGAPASGQLTSVSDGTNTWAAPITFSNGGQVWSNLDYTANPPTSADTAVATWTYSGNAGTGGAPIWILVISNADATPLDNNITCNGNDTGGSANVTLTCNNTITPVQANELLIGIMATNNNGEGETANSAGPSPAVAIVADSTPEIPTSPIDENDGLAIAYLTSTATVTPTWNIFSPSTPCPGTGCPGTGQWTDIHAVFEPAPLATGGRQRTLLRSGR